MKKITRLVSIALLAVFIVVSVFGCYGNMSLTKKVYRFNGSVGNKFVQSIVNWAFLICPVYEIAMFLDVFVFLAMNAGENIIKYAEGPNGNYKFEISQNKIVISQPENKDNNQNIELNYDPVSESWFMNSNGTTQKIGYLDGNQLKLLSQSGEEISLDLSK